MAPISFWTEHDPRPPNKRRGGDWEITYPPALITGDRACVDLACLMRPGEGMLVGSFARGLFLVGERWSLCAQIPTCFRLVNLRLALGLLPAALGAL